MRQKTSKTSLKKRIIELQLRVKELEEIFEAIQSRKVDALVVNDKNKKSVVMPLLGSEIPYSIMVESMAEGAFTITKGGTILYCNKKFAQLLERRIKELVGSSIYKYLSDEQGKEIKALVSKRCKFGKIELSFLAKNSTLKTMYLSFTKLKFDQAEVVSVVATDISELLRLKKELSSSEILYRELVESSPFGIFILRKDKIVFANASFKRILDLPTNTPIINKSLLDLLHKNSKGAIKDFFSQLLVRVLDGAVMESNWIKLNGYAISLEIIGKVFMHHNEEEIQIILNDITARKKMEKQLEYVATHDVLTGLINRNTLEEKIERALDALCEHDAVAVFYIDIDTFKEVNDTYGHHVGDLLLKEVSKRLLFCVRKTDVVARLGGDEFIILLNGIMKKQIVISLAGKILKCFKSKFAIDNLSLAVTISIGICVSDSNSSCDSNTLLKNADLALYNAKNHGKNSFVIFTEQMAAENKQKASIEKDLQSAIKKHQLELYYQPQYDIRKNGITSAEALLRWFHPEQLIPPGTFIPVAERTGIINKIGEWVLAKACKQFLAWKVQYQFMQGISINLSPVQLREIHFAERFAVLIKKTGINPQNLVVELTEEALITNFTHTVSTLDKLQHLGVSLSIDDFGTGYSSLSYLKNFSLNELKIDRSFTKEIGKNRKCELIVLTIIAIGHSLGATVIAEGVETQEQYEFLVKQGCDKIQGNLISPPVSAKDFKKLLQKHRPQK